MIDLKAQLFDSYWVQLISIDWFLGCRWIDDVGRRIQKLVRSSAKLHCIRWTGWYQIRDLTARAAPVASAQDQEHAVTFYALALHSAGGDRAAARMA